MVYTSPQGISRRILDVGSSDRAEPMDFSALLDPTLLQAARHIYRTYYEVHPDQIHRPIGVALDRFTYRGQLIFGKQPILLPQECFVPLNQIESELH